MAVDLLQRAVQAFDVRDWLSERVRVHKSGPTNISASECPICGKKSAKFYARANGDRHNGSFTAYCCHHSGGLLTLIGLVEGFTREEAVDFLIERLEGEETRIVPVLREEQPAAEQRPLPELPHPLYPAVPDYPIFVKGEQRTLAWRGADSYIIGRHGLGLTYIGTIFGKDDRGRPQRRKDLDYRLVIPIRRGADVIGWQARDLTDSSKRKYLFPAGDLSREWLYDLDAHEGSTIIIAEGVFHKWAWDRFGLRYGCGYDRMAVASFGKSLTAAQIDLLIARPHITDVVLAWDLDAAPEIDKVAKLLVGRKRVHVMHAHPSGRDHDELDDAELAGLLHGIEPYTPELGVRMKTALALANMAR